MYFKKFFKELIGLVDPLPLVTNFKKTLCPRNFWMQNADLPLKSYNLYRADDPDNVKKGGVCVYCKETIAVHFLQTKLD